MASGTPSAQVRIPLTGPLLPPPQFCSHYTTWGKNIRERQRKGPEAVGSANVRQGGRRRKKLYGGETIIRRRNNYPGGRGWTKTSEKNSHSAENCRTVPKRPYSIS